MLNELKEAYRYRTVIYVYASLKVRYKRSILGYLWTVLAPMGYYFVLAFIFSYGLRTSMPGSNYYVYMFSGAIIFSAISSVINQASTIMFVNEGYIKKIYVPKMVFVLNVVLYEFANFLLVMLAVLILGFAAHQISFSYHFIFALVPMLLSVLFTSGAALIISIVSLYFRDLSHMVPVLMNACFFGTPIMWYNELAPPLMRKLNYLNPFYYFVELFREPFLNNRLPDLKLLGICSSFTIVVFVVGLFMLSRFNNRIIFKL